MGGVGGEELVKRSWWGGVGGEELVGKSWWGGVGITNLFLQIHQSEDATLRNIKFFPVIFRIVKKCSSSNIIFYKEKQKR